MIPEGPELRRTKNIPAATTRPSSIAALQIRPLRRLSLIELPSRSVPVESQTAMSIGKSMIVMTRLAAFWLGNSIASAANQANSATPDTDTQTRDDGSLTHEISRYWKNFTMKPMKCIKPVLLKSWMWIDSNCPC